MPDTKKTRVVAAMSGGVDSSVAALLLKKQGYDVIGLFMHNGVEEKLAHTTRNQKSCCSARDAQDAREVAGFLKIPFYSLDFSRPFEDLMNNFVEEYFRARTPNPCVRCNQFLKFGQLMEFARTVGADFVGTGHYARIEAVPERYRLRRAVDTTKDQSYVLFALSQAQLERSLFPLGALHKSEVRELARQEGFPLADKPESQDVCFIPSGQLGDFLQERKKIMNSPSPQPSPLQERGSQFSTNTLTEGEVVDQEGHVLGYHSGYFQYTVGQRRGLGIATGQPAYVVEIQPQHNRIVLGTNANLLKRGCEVSEVNWMSIPEPAPGTALEVSVKIRHAHSPAPAVVSVMPEETGAVEESAVSGRGIEESRSPGLQEPRSRGVEKSRSPEVQKVGNQGAGNGSRVRVLFKTPQRAITPGQAAVFYEGDLVLGGGWIDKALS